MEVPLLPFVLAGVFRVTKHLVGFLLDGSLEKSEVKKRSSLEFLHTEKFAPQFMFKVEPPKLEAWAAESVLNWAVWGKVSK